MPDDTAPLGGKANLAGPIKPGEVRNPKGQNQWSVAQAALAQFMRETPDPKNPDRTRFRNILLAAYTSALVPGPKGAADRKWLGEMAAGKPKQQVDLSSEDGSMSPNRKPTTAETRQELDRVLAAIKEEVEAGQTNTEPKDEP